MHEAESKYWITSENINQLITRDLFLKPSTTGVITPISEHWRYYCPSLSPQQTMKSLLEADDSDEDSDYEDEEVLENNQNGSNNREIKEHIKLDPAYLQPIDYNMDSEQYVTGEKEKIRNMLNNMIGEGVDREKYDSIVREFVDLSETLSGPMTNMGRPGKFAGEKLPSFKSLSKNDLLDLLADPSVSPFPL